MFSVSCGYCAVGIKRQSILELGEDLCNELLEAFGVLLRMNRCDFSSRLQSTKRSMADWKARKQRMKATLYAGDVLRPHAKRSLLRVMLSHPVFDSLGSVSGFLLGIILRQHINQTHEVHLPPGSTYEGMIHGVCWVTLMPKYGERSPFAALREVTLRSHSPTALWTAYTST